jgi:hypothetical protein
VSHPDDLALLRRFEPIIRYTRGEWFFPMDVERYVQMCSLWVKQPNRYPMRIAARGDLTLAKLADQRPFPMGTVRYLKFVNPLSITEMAALQLQKRLSFEHDAESFDSGPGRLARVGYSSRLIDALFSLSLLARGRVPGDTALAAARAYHHLLEEEERYTYYGRVVRRFGWTVLQYWFFYAFNNWRSGFYGANDHESDWEMVCVYLSECEDGRSHPVWVAYASHDAHGDDLRRHWDDPELERVGDHPVVYSGAGSHASHFQPGEYLTELELPFLHPVTRFVDRVQGLWQRIWPYDNNGNNGEARWSSFSLFRVPFVDYARGDGRVIGPGAAHTWAAPQLLDPPPAWVSHYRGLWGLYTRDPLSGEDAPAGPMYNRDGAVRRAWYDPLGWAGLDKAPPPHQRLMQVESRQSDLRAAKARLQAQIEEKSYELTGLGVEMDAMQGNPHLAQTRKAVLHRAADVTAELNALKAELAAKETLAESLARYAARVARGERDPLRGHIRRPHQPTTHAELRLNRFAEAWAAISIGLLMIGFVLIVLFARQYLFWGLGLLLTVLIFIEAGVRSNLTRLISSFTGGLAILAALVLIFEFFWQIVIGVVLISGGYIMWENLRELRR